MTRNQMNKAPFLLIAIVIIAVLFLSCTKKPQPTDAKNPMNNVFTTPHGFKVMMEQAPMAPAPATPQAPSVAPKGPMPRLPASAPGSKK